MGRLPETPLEEFRSDGSAVRRFFAKVEKVPGGCWLWHGCIGGHGYGQIKWRGTAPLVHRVSWVLNGGTIPAGMVIDHVCRVRSCLNPCHLRVVSFRENLLENSVSPPAENASKTHCLNGHPLSGANVPASGRRRCLPCERARAAAHRSAMASDPAWVEAERVRKRAVNQRKAEAA